MEVLSLWLINASNNKKSGIGIKLCPRSNKVPGLLFVDDCLLFCKTTTTSSKHLKSILDKFRANSGQLINYHKSTLTFSSNATTHQKNIVTSIFHIPHRASLGKYLGCPIFQGRPSKTNFKDIIDKATAKLQGWKTNCLSNAGRAILIQSHLESIPAHTMQCFQIPPTTSHQIDKLSCEFFWNHTNTGKGLQLIAWDKLYLPKNKGGLGLRKTEAVNKAFRCKLAWKILTNHTSLWVQMLRAKYLQKSDFFS